MIAAEQVNAFEADIVSVILLAFPWALTFAGAGWLLSKLIAWRKGRRHDA